MGISVVSMFQLLGIIPALLVTTTSLTEAFLLRQPQVALTITSSSTTSTSVLWAKKATKRKTNTNKKSTASGAGFGGSTTATTQQKKKKAAANTADDYAVFPALEPDVKETLVRADGSDEKIGELPNEIYQRLDQIYGFRHFNYEEKVAEGGSQEAPPLSLQEMLSGSGLLEEDDDDGDDNSSENELPISKLPPFENFQVLHVDPLVLQVDDFFTPEESDAYIEMTTSGTKDQYKTGSLTVGKDDKSKAQRTSTTWFNHYKNVPALMAKASRLLGLDTIDQWEEPQTVRYRKSEKFTWHLDALGPQELSSSKGGQRTATLLVYHTDLEEHEGGATVFRDLKDPDGGRLKMRPKKGSALLFFPAAGGIPNTPLDIRTLHCGEAVSSESKNDKWISQIWLRQTPNSYIPTAPQGNSHAAAADAIADFCQLHS